MFKLLAFILSILLSTAIHAQPFQLSGIVINADNGQPLEGASVFINNASKGTSSSKSGEFILSDINSSSFDLVVSFVSFETIVVKISPDNINKRFRIEMAPKKNELQEVVVGPVDKDGWKNWGKLFTEYFIGTSENAKNCTIKNLPVLRFRYNKKTRVLRVTAVDKLKIENKALGLTIDYQLEEFIYDAQKSLTTYSGYSSFAPMSSKSDRKLAHWRAARLDAYNGSVMHFMRAFYNNQTVAQGFELRQLIRLHKEDTTTTSFYNRIISGDLTVYDTAKFSSQLMKGSGLGNSNPIIFIMGRNLLPADSIRILDTAYNAIHLSFANNLMVDYNKEPEKTEYALQQNPSRKPRPYQSSIINLTNYRSVIVQNNGVYFEPLDLMAEGYWGWEKMAEFLPTDYEIGE